MSIIYKIVVNKIRQQKWWREEMPTSYFLFDYIMRTFVNGGRIIGYQALKQAIYIVKDHIGMEITPYQEKKENFLYIYKQELKQPGYFKKLFADWPGIRKELLILNEKAINKAHNYSKDQLIRFTKQFLKLGFDSVVYGAFLECLDPYSEELPEKFQKKYNLDINKTQELISILAVQPKRSFLTQEKIDFNELCLGQVSKEIYLKKYHWINSNYQKSTDLKTACLEKKVSQELKNKSRAKIKKEILETQKQERELIKQKRKIAKKIKLTKEDKALFKLMEIFGYYTDLRKESMVRHSHARDKLLTEISSRTKQPISDLRAMLDKEILNILKGQKVNLKQIRLRHKQSAVYYTPNSQTIFYGNEAKEIYNAYMASLKSHQIKGMVASAPKDVVKGKISLVMDVSRDKFKPGSILVTTMTRPEFMPLMRKAKAVITDEGGVICHAAIVSRELKIPCIIGAKNATKSLKDGDMVEMDLRTGIVRKIR